MTDPATCDHPQQHLTVEPKLAVQDGKRMAWLRIRCKQCNTVFPVLNGQTEPQLEPPT